MPGDELLFLEPRIYTSTIVGGSIKELELLAVSNMSGNN